MTCFCLSDHALLDGSQPDLAGAAVDVDETLAAGCGADKALAAALDGEVQGSQSGGWRRPGSPWRTVRQRENSLTHLAFRAGIWRDWTRPPPCGGHFHQEPNTPNTNLTKKHQDKIRPQLSGHPIASQVDT